MTPPRAVFDGPGHLDATGSSAAHSEQAILQRILSTAAPASSPEWLEVGPGDDAAVLRVPTGRIVATTDTLVQGVDFLPHTTAPVLIGRKAAVQNLADVAAMGARPLALLAAVSVPAGTPTDVLTQITVGLTEQSQRWGAELVGGDMGTGDALSLTITALGTLEKGQPPALRSGARPGDVLAIGTAQLGRSAAGLALVLADRCRIATDEHGALRVQLIDVLTPGAEELLLWHNAPDPDLSIGWGSGRRARAMMDLSDGLSRDAARIASASNIVLELDRAVLATDAEALRPLAHELNADPWDWVLHGGEEHALLASFPAGAVPAGFRQIGRVRAPRDGEKPAVVLDGAPLPVHGWDHFA